MVESSDQGHHHRQMGLHAVGSPLLSYIKKTALFGEKEREAEEEEEGCDGMSTCLALSSYTIQYSSCSTVLVERLLDGTDTSFQLARPTSDSSSVLLYLYQGLAKKVSSLGRKLVLVLTSIVASS